MKIIYILNSPTKHGGANKSLLALLDGLIEKGVIPFIIIPSNGEIIYELDKRGISYFIVKLYMDVYPPIIRKRNIILFIPRILNIMFINYLAKIKIKKIIKTIKPDFIHTNVGPLHVGYKIAKELRIPHIWHLREYQILDFKLYPLFSMKSFNRKLKSINNYSIAITRGIFEYFSLNANSKMIYNGILNKTQITNISKKEKFFLFAGRIESNKGVKNLIDAFSEFASGNVDYNLLIAGDTNNIVYKEYIYNLVKNKRLENRIVFLGMIDNVYEYMSKATALIVPSIYEGFGRITAEAMFNGCLVIGFNSAGTKEIIVSEKYGILYSSHSELVNSLKLVVEKGVDFFNHRIINAQIKAVQLYSIEQNVENIYKFYIEIKNKNHEKNR